MPSKEKPYILLVAELIYSKVCEIKEITDIYTDKTESIASTDAVVELTESV